MDRGFLLESTQRGAAETKWMHGAPEPSFWMGIKTAGKDLVAVEAYKCPRCHVVKLFAPPA
jgi:hypothetical protein